MAVGWRFRRSVKKGPLRLGFSRRGMGVSVGIPGLRVGRSSTGKHYLSVGLPGTGIHYMHYFGGKSGRMGSSVSGPDAAPDLGKVVSAGEFAGPRLLASDALAPGAKLSGGVYGVGKALACDHLSITYLGSEIRLHRLVIIQEFFPQGCIRQGNAVLLAGRWTSTQFAEARQRFLREGQAREQAHGSPRVLAVFAENNTAYRVVEHSNRGA